MEIPTEIWEIILSNISDVTSLSSCRKTCHIFREILTNRNEKIEKEKRRIFQEKIKKRNRKEKEIKLDFLLTFPKLKIADYPIVIKKYNDFYNIYTLKNRLKKLRKITLRLEIDPGLFSIFLESYPDILKEMVLKIVNLNSITWMTKNYYAKYGSDDLNITDFNLMNVCECKHFISNYKMEKDFYFPLIESYTYLSTIDDLSFSDYEAPLFCKNYYWRPIKYEDRRKIDNLFSLSSSINLISEVRPKVKTYELPILPQHIEKMKNVYFNCNSYRTLYSSDDFLNGSCEEKCFYYSSQKIFFLEGIDLSNPPDAETYIDNLFLGQSRDIFI